MSYGDRESIGGGVYVQYKGGVLRVSTSGGYSDINQIFMDDKTLSAFLDCVERKKAERKKKEVKKKAVIIRSCACILLRSDTDRRGKR